MHFLRTELTRGYQLEHDEERFSARREKIYSFMQIPREVEKFMTYGFLQVESYYVTVRKSTICISHIISCYLCFYSAQIPFSLCIHFYR